MSFFKKNSKTKGLVVLGLLVATGIAGIASAYIPAPGEFWLEYTWYNSSGTLVGAHLYDCDGTEHEWGVQSGTRKATKGPCP